MERAVLRQDEADAPVLIDHGRGVSAKFQGAEPEDLFKLDIPALIIPGHDASHATSAARYLEECMPRSEYWDASIEDQTEQAASLRVLEFLHKAGK